MKALMRGIRRVKGRVLAAALNQEVRRGWDFAIVHLRRCSS
jgi:hypothetical protein